jgi:hypothetical protein
LLPYSSVTIKYYQRKEKAGMRKFIKAREKHGRIAYMAKVSAAHDQNK